MCGCNENFGASTSLSAVPIKTTQLTIEQTNQAQFHNWNVVPSFRTICVKRSQHFDFISLTANLYPDGSCKLGFRKCPDDGNNESDVVCMPKGSKCPVSHFNFISFASSFGKGPALSQLVTSMNHVCRD